MAPPDPTRPPASPAKAEASGGVCPPELVAELRSDHAGETGSVWICRGILAASRDAGVRAMARGHLATERSHREKIAWLLPWRRRSRLLPLWRVAGFLTGALPALCGARAVYATIAAVELFVELHYQHQIDALAGRPEHSALREVLLECQADECDQREEAVAALHGGGPGRLLGAWCRAVGGGSALAVALSRRW